eukprot:COSAG06_NODE_61920_length_266_cov_0.904192_1_plen_35_part_01
MRPHCAAQLAARRTRNLLLPLRNAPLWHQSTRKKP